MKSNIVYVVIFVASIIFVISGILLYNVHKKKKMRCTKIAKGEIIGKIRHSSTDDDGTSYYYYNYEYEYSVGDETIRREMKNGTVETYHIGQKIDVYYNPDRCSEHFIEGMETNFTSSAKALLLLGLGMMLGLIMIFLSYFFASLIV